jgi:hypothetical protein
LLRFRTPALLRGIGLLAVVGTLSATTQVPAQTQRFAQTEPAQSYDPLAPIPSDSSAQKKPRSYQAFDRSPASATADQPKPFEPPAPAAGAGNSGFDSSNARKRARATKPRTAKARTAANERDIAPGDPAPVPSSPYQRATPTNGKSAYASAGQPGQPPVELGNTPPPRKKKKKRDETDPYDPLGMRSGGLLYYPAVELIGGYDSNPSRASNGKGTAIGTVAPELRVRSDWLVHEFKADLRGSYNWYSPDGVPSLDRPYFNGTTEGRIDINRDSRIDLAGRLQVSTDNPNSPNLSADLAKLPIYTSVGATAGLGQKFNRLDVSLKGTVDRTIYQESQLTDGTISSNDDRNFNQYGGILRAGYELSPGITPFVEVGADQRVHDLPVDLSGFHRDSKGWTAMVGSTFELSRMLIGDIAAGYVHREYDDPRLLPLNGFVGKGSLTWAATPLTTVKFTATSTVGESNVADVSGVLYRDAGLQVDHALRRWLIGSLKAGIGLDDYVGSPRTDHRYYFGAGLTYKLTRFVQVKGEVRHEWLDSSETVNNYAANIFLIGLRLQY